MHERRKEIARCCCHVFWVDQECVDEQPNLHTLPYPHTMCVRHALTYCLPLWNTCSAVNTTIFSTHLTQPAVS
jgi:hypothetical protein